MRDASSLKHAQAMRKDMPEPERRLWLELRAAHFQGVKFRRQKVIGRYIADFASNDPELVIELDGDSHAGRESYDDARTRFLEEQGYRVIRFSNSKRVNRSPRNIPTSIKLTNSLNWQRKPGFC